MSNRFEMLSILLTQFFDKNMSYLVYSCNIKNCALTADFDYFNEVCSINLSERLCSYWLLIKTADDVFKFHVGVIFENDLDIME